MPRHSSPALRLCRGDPADIDSSTAAEIKDALSRCREAVLLGRVADLAPLKMVSMPDGHMLFDQLTARICIRQITSLYQRLLSVPVRGSPASRHVDGAQVALFCAALGDSNAALRSQVVTAWISGMSPADASCQLEQCAADMMRVRVTLRAAA